MSLIQIAMDRSRTSTVLFGFMAFVFTARGLCTVFEGFSQFAPPGGVTHFRNGQKHLVPDFIIPRTQKCVIASRQSSAASFGLRHIDMDGDPLAPSAVKEPIRWFPSVDGMDQAVLDEWSDITKLHRLNASDFQDVSKRKEGVATPHVVGCYMSHWRLLQNVWEEWQAVEQQDSHHQGGKQQAPLDSILSDRHEIESITVPSSAGSKSSRPDMLFVFEDDSHCVSNLTQRTWEVVQKLPKDWDLLYIGGKPFAYHTHDLTFPRAILNSFRNNGNGTIPARPSEGELKEGVCKGRYGKSSTGPFAPTCNDDMSQCTSEPNLNLPLSLEQPFWRTKYILNTNAYVVNPRRIERVLRLLAAPTDHYRPIDVRLAEDMWREGNVVLDHESFSSPLKAFTPTRMFCDQHNEPRRIESRDEPPP